MISNEKLKPFILHKDKNVRSEILRYFQDGNIIDSEIMQLSMQAGEKYGFEENLYLLHQNKHQQVDDTAAEQLLNIYKNTTDNLLRMHISSLLSSGASINFLKKQFGPESQLDGSQKWKLATYRIDHSSLSHDELWKRLKAFALDSKDVEYYSKIDIQKLDAIIEMLANSDHLYDEVIVSELERFHDMALNNGEEFDQHWVWCAFLIRLAGRKKIIDAIEIINEFLKIDSDVFQLEAVKALCNIGTAKVVEAIENDFIKQRWYYRLYATSVLENIKSKYSEDAVLRLLQKKTEYEHDIYCHLCFSLCYLCSNQAFKWGKTILNDIVALEFDNIKEKLILLAIIFNINLPEAKKWKSQFRNDTARLSKARRLALLARGIQENHINLPDDTEDDDDDMPDDITDFNTPTKIGRNELCSCGSGKKYKKCCEKTTIRK